MFLLSETYLKPHESFLIPNYHSYRTNRFPSMKGRTAIAVRKGIPHIRVDLLPLISVEASEFCIPTANSKVLLAAVHISQSRAWSNADIIELLCIERSSLLTDDLNAKNPVGIVKFQTLQERDFLII